MQTLIKIIPNFIRMKYKSIFTSLAYLMFVLLIFVACKKQDDRRSSHNNIKQVLKFITEEVYHDRESLNSLYTFNGCRDIYHGY